MPIDTSILGGITLPQLRDPQQEAIQRFNLQTAQLQQQRMQQQMQTERENAVQTAQLNEAMNQAWGFVSQYMDPDTGMIPTEKFREIISNAGIPGKYASNVINMMKTMNADVIAQRKNEADWQKAQNDLAESKKKRETYTMATLADQLLGIDDPGARNVAFLANFGRLVAHGKVDKNTSQQILSSISNPDGSINPDRMTAVLESVVRMDKDVAASRQAAQKPTTYGAEAKWYLVDGEPVLARTSSDGKMVDAYGNKITGKIEPMPEKLTPYQEQMLKNDAARIEMERQRLNLVRQQAASKSSELGVPKSQEAKVQEILELSEALNNMGRRGEAAKWKGTGKVKGWLSSFASEAFGFATPEAEKESDFRVAINSLKGTINKIRNGATFTAGERQLLESYVPTIGETWESLASKARGLQDWLNARMAGVLGVTKGVNPFMDIEQYQFPSKFGKQEGVIAPPPSGSPQINVKLPGTWQPEK
jgi:hypothetical protein